MSSVAITSFHVISSGLFLHYWPFECYRLLQPVKRKCSCVALFHVVVWHYCFSRCPHDVVPCWYFAGEGAADVVRASQSVQPGEGQRHVAVQGLCLLRVRGHQRHRPGIGERPPLLPSSVMYVTSPRGAFSGRRSPASTGCSWGTKSWSSKEPAWEPKTPTRWARRRNPTYAACFDFGCKD